jgi:hypothetical protein
MHEPHPSSSVILTVPTETAYLRHVRVLAATVADDLGFDVESIESLRVAVDELCALAISDVDGSAGALRLTLSSEEDGLVLTGRCGPVTTDPDVDPIAEQLIRAGSSSHELHRDGDECVFVLRASAPAADHGR